MKMRFATTFAREDSKMISWSTKVRAGVVGSFERTEQVEPLGDHDVSVVGRNDDDVPAQIDIQRSRPSVVPGVQSQPVELHKHFAYVPHRRGWPSRYGGLLRAA